MSDAMLSAQNLDAVEPPQPYMTITRHKLPGGLAPSPLFHFLVDVEPGANYLAQVWVYIPGDYEGSNVSIIFFGNTPIDLQQADLTLRDTWQELSVKIVIPDGVQRIAPSLVVGTSNRTELLSSGWGVRRIDKTVRAPISKTRFEVVSLEDIIRRGRHTVDGRPLVKRTACLPDVEVPIPAVAYGQIEPPQDVIQYPADNWKCASYNVHDAAMYTLHDAVVHGEQGIITVGDMIIAESLYLGHLKFMGFEQEPGNKNVYFLSDYTSPETWVDSASHVMCGYVSNRNYAHWWVNVVPAIMVPPFHDAFGKTTLLMSQIRTQWQRDTLALLPEVNGCTVFLGENSRIGCRELRFVPKVNRSDFEPHPFRKKILNTVKERAGFTGQGGRRLYLSRRDASARKLLNEDEVATLLERYGFEIVLMTGRPVADQIKLFAEASHIVSPHGAGLGNIIFCPADSALCEFQMTSNVQWSIRRLAAVTGMRYGCIMGHAEDDTANVWERNWQVNLAELEKVLQDPVFMNAPTLKLHDKLIL